MTAFGVPAALLVGLEIGLRLGGYGRPAEFLIPDRQPGFYRTNPDYLRLFMPGSFDLRPLNYRVSLVKPPNTLRVVVLGESAAQGIPEPMFGFAPQLRAQLRARYPGTNIEVINTGIVAINSHVVCHIARDLARFSPDVFVVYMGNNEVVGPYGPGCAYLSQMPPRWAIRLSIFVRSTRTGQMMGSIIDRFAGRNRHPVDWGGMSMFVHAAVPGDDPRLDSVYRNFEANLRDIVAIAGDAGARTLLCTVVANLKDCAPFLSLHRPSLTTDELSRWQQAFDRGRFEWALGESPAAKRDLERALTLDPHYADTAFLLGSVDMKSGDLAAARRYFTTAEHWDALRFRPDPQLNEIIRRVARESRAGLVDAALVMGADPNSGSAPCGRELLFEHVHFDWPGNFQLARLLAAGVEELTRAKPNGEWLDSAHCAAALGYTPHERYGVLLKNSYVVDNPPFTNQLTYSDDQARLAQQMAEAQASATAPDTLRKAKAVVDGAIAHDPENPALAKIAEELDDDRGDLNAALADIRRAETLQPENFALFTDEAIKLSRLGRYTEAENLLKRTAANCAPRDQALMAPAFVDLYTRTNRLAEALPLLESVIAHDPFDRKLRLLHARVQRQLGKTNAAEQEYRAMLADDPGNADALEALIALLSETGRRRQAEDETLAATARQPGNHANNLRAVLICDARGDDARSIQLLLAAEKSGPVTSAVELQLARKLFNSGRRDDALLHLAFAERLSAIEGDRGVTSRIADLIRRIRERST